VADAIGQDQEVAPGVEELARPEQLAGELRAQKGLSAAPVPCSSNTAFVARPAESRRSVPRVV
jgi:hypothetical protein